MLLVCTQFFHSFGGKGYNNHHVGASTHFSILISPPWCLTLNTVCAYENVFAEIIGIEITLIEWDEIVNCQLAMLCICRT